MKHDLSYCCCFEISWQVVQVIVNAYCQRLRNMSSWDVPAYGSYLNPRQEQWSSSFGEPLLRLYLCCFCFSCLLWCQSICFPVIQLNVFKLKKKCCNREFIKSERKKKRLFFSDNLGNYCFHRWIIKLLWVTAVLYMDESFWALQLIKAVQQLQ